MILTRKNQNVGISLKITVDTDKNLSLDQFKSHSAYGRMIMLFRKKIHGLHVFLTFHSKPNCSAKR